MNQVETAVNLLSTGLWKFVPLPLLFAGGYFGLRTVLVQIRMIPDMFRSITEKPGGKEPDSASGGISAFKAFTISAASRVGTANVAGVALAITTGGPGAVFWMWMIALVGGATSFVESTLAQLWKVRDGHSYRGGPAYYMTRGLRAPWLAAIFGVAITITFGLVYNALQTNALVEAVSFSLGHESVGARFVIGIGMAVLTALVIFGGVQRIANVTQFIVPFMAGAYVIMGVVVIILNFDKVPGMFSDIIGHALGLKEIAGATFGAAFQYGMQRGLFSNEAGEGSAPNAAATATVSHPVKQGLVQTLGVYFDTILVCSITAFIILLSNPTYGSEAQTSSLTQTALAGEVGGWGVHFITAVLFFLAFSSVIGNYYLAQANIQYFTDSYRFLTIFRSLVVLCVVLGAVANVPLVWSMGDMFAGIMVCINIIAIVPLGGVAIKLLKNFNQQRRRGLDPVFQRDMLPEIRNVECWDGSDPVTRMSDAHREAVFGGK